MAKKKRGDAHGGGHGWFVTFADLMGLMMSFFVMLVAFSTQDKQKLQIVAGSMRDAFGVQQVRFNGIIEPATIFSLLASCVENATSITKKLIIRPIRSAKVTNQP